MAAAAATAIIAAPMTASPTLALASAPAHTIAAASAHAHAHAIAQQTPDSTTSQTKNNLLPSLDIASATATTVAADQDLIIHATLSAPAGSDATFSGISVSDNYSLLSNRSLLFYWMDGTLPTRVLATLPEPVTVPAGKSTTVTFELSPEQRNWDSGSFSWGAHGIQVNALADYASESDPAQRTSTSISQRSVVVALPEDQSSLSPMPLSIVVNESLRPEARPIPSTFDEFLTAGPTTDASTGQTAADPATAGQTTTPALNERLKRWDTKGVAVFIDPSELTGLDASADPLQLDSAQIYALAVHDPDWAALAHTDSSALAERFVQETKDAQDLGQVDTSLDFAPYSQPTTSLLVPLQSQIGIDEDTLALLDSQVGTPILPSELLPLGADLTYTPDARASIAGSAGSHSVLVSDSLIEKALLGVLENPIRTQTVLLNTTQSAAVTTALGAIFYTDAPNLERSLVVQVSGSAFGGDADRLSSLATHVSQFTALPFFTPTKLADLAQGDDASAGGPNLTERTLAPSSPDPNEIGSVEASAYASASADLDSFLKATALEDAELNESTHAALDSLWSVQLRPRAEERNAAFGALNLTKYLAEKVQTEPAAVINMISQDAEIPVAISSSLDLPITITATLESPDAKLQAGEPVTVTLAPRQSTTLRMPAQGRGSGNVEAHLNLATSTGTPIGTSTPIRVRVRADWENKGTIAIGVLIAAVLAVGIFRSTRSGSRSDKIAG